jgi:hypothetical protein
VNEEAMAGVGPQRHDGGKFQLYLIGKDYSKGNNIVESNTLRIYN